VGISRLAVLLTAVAVTAAVVVLVPHVGLIYGLPAHQVTLETTASLVTLLAAFLVFGRLRRNSRLNDLVLAVALAIIALSNLIFSLLPMLLDSDSAAGDPVVFSAVIGRTAGGLLFTAAAFVPRARLRRPGQALGLAVIGVLGTLVLAVIIPRVFGSGLPPVVTGTDDQVRAAPALAVTEIVAAVLAVTAAAGYLRRSERLGDEFSCWLAIAAVFAAASHANYALDPSVYSARVSLGDIFRACFCIVLLIGSMREIQAYWRTLTTAIVAEERRRIARDLHDGLSQELAYLTRNLSGLQGAADEKTLGQLQVSVNRARLAARQAIQKVAVADRPTVTDALTEAAGEVAERLGLELKLDLASGIGMAPARADALVRIACEALTNVARHSGSRRASLMLWRDGEHVRMQVRDSGHGFDTAACSDGFGLTSMRDRARSVGGELRISSELGAGSRVEAML
jgi:signal transduction histidine kinase